MTPGPITSWEIEGEKEETGTDFIFVGSKITADGDCSHEIKRRLLLGRKAMTNLDSILKSRDFTDKGPNSQSYSFSTSHIWICELNHQEGWQPKNLCFCAVLLEKIPESPLDCKEIKQVNPKGNQPWILIGRLMLKLKLQYFGHLMLRASSLEKTLMLGKIEDKRRRGWKGWDGWMASLTQWTRGWANSGRQCWTGKPGVHGVKKSWTWLSNETTTTGIYVSHQFLWVMVSESVDFSPCNF